MRSWIEFSRAIRCLGLLTILLLTSCTVMKKDYPKEKSTAFQKPASTKVGAIFEKAAAAHPGKSGFALVPGNREAFTDRAALADLAEKTLDVQYFIWSSDTAGRMLGDKIVKAADRGVRVRFLLDDINFKKRDSAAAAISAHPNIEVRIFNPHRYRNLRTLELGLDFSRLNKRMHNKIMVMDNSCVIVGGRNIADEYFGLGETQNNRDLDIFAAGPIVRDISSTFDEFWNSKVSIPIEALVSRRHTMEDYREALALSRSKMKPERYHFSLEDDLRALRSRLHTVKDRLIWARGEVIHDSFDSMTKRPKKRKIDETVAGKLSQQMQAAKKELLIESAYFVLRDSGVEFCRETTERGVKIRVFTNSLASNNVLAAQAGHAKRRKALVRAGAELYEMKPDAPSVLNEVAPHGKNSMTTLHSKAMVIDEEKAFVGSFNFDPRSAEINSEIGIMVYSPVFAKQVKAFLDDGIREENAYRVYFNERNKLIWETTIDGEVKQWRKAPKSSFFERLTSGAISLLPIEGQL